MLLFILYVSCVLFQIIYGFWFYEFLKKNWKKVNANTNNTARENFPAVSVIICAKNEAANLQKHLTKILEQQYQYFEVLVIDDYSKDKTINVLKDFQKKYPILKIIYSDQFEDIPGKKLALSKAIEIAQHDILLFTDADCYPNSLFWIQEMTARFTKEIDIVLGYGPYIKTKGWLNSFIRFETTITALNYFSFALRGEAYMGVGRNLAYRKSLFYKVGGFSKHLHIASGDDDLLVSQMSSSTNIASCISTKSWCFSNAKKSWSGYVQQKNRHVSTATSYKRRTQFLLGFYALSHILMYILLIYLVFFKLFLFLSVFILLLKTFSQYYLYHYLFSHLGVKDLWVYIPLFDIMFLGYYFFNLPGVVSFKNNVWQ